MNYANYFPNNYYPAQPQPQTQAPQQQTQSAFISVKNIDEALNWPIAPGNSLTFKDESVPYIYTKTMGLSQFEQPVFEKYKIIKEEEPKAEDVFFQAKSDIESQLGEIKDGYKLLKNEIDEIKSWLRQPFVAQNNEREGGVTSAYN